MRNKGMEITELVLGEERISKKKAVKVLQINRAHRIFLAPEGVSQVLSSWVFRCRSLARLLAFFAGQGEATNSHQPGIVYSVINNLTLYVPLQILPSRKTAYNLWLCLSAIQTFVWKQRSAPSNSSTSPPSLPRFSAKQRCLFTLRSRPRIHLGI